MDRPTADRNALDADGLDSDLWMEATAMSIYQRSHFLTLATALCIVLTAVAGSAKSGTSSDALVAQADAPAAAGSAQEGAKDASPGGMSDDMMADDMMSQGMMGMGHGMGSWKGRAMGMMPMSGAARMKIMFAIVDTNGDGALSFEEIMAVHKRVFDVIDANKDGKVTMDELRAFMRQ